MNASTTAIQKYRDLNEPMTRRYCPLCGLETWQIPVSVFALPYPDNPELPAERVLVAWRCDSCMKITDTIVRE